MRKSLYPPDATGRPTVRSPKAADLRRSGAFRPAPPRIIAPSARRKNHHHLPAFELGLVFDLGDRLDLLADLVEQLHAKLQMRHLAAAEAQGQLDLVAFIEKP